MDVFDFAMKMELQGKAFYETQAALTQIIGLKTVFTGLAADEQKHYGRHLLQVNDSFIHGSSIPPYISGNLHQVLQASPRP